MASVPASSTSRGQQAEACAADYLTKQGFTIQDRNWRNRWCELDIVATKDTVVHFVEVKYRRSSTYGYPAEYVSPDKLGRLARAALAWNQARGYSGTYQVDVISVEGDLSRPILEYLPSITR